MRHAECRCPSMYFDICRIKMRTYIKMSLANCRLEGCYFRVYDICLKTYRQTIIDVVQLGKMALESAEN